MRELVENARLDKREGALQVAFLQHPNAPGVKAIEGAHGVDPTDARGFPE
jgi:hypothetical protein